VKSNPIVLRHAAALARAGLAAACLLAAGGAWAGAPKPVVVELFTSQGCSSCPPADRILSRLAEREGVIALGFHVTYWDRLGWPDPFATRAGTDRQYAYAPALARHNVYTPQMVIDGRHDVAGFDMSRIEAALAEAGAAAHTRFEVGLEWLARGRLGYTLPEGRGDARIRLARYARSLDQRIQRGENAGRHLRYSNVVREIAEVARWTGAALQGEIAVRTPPDEPGGYALLVQDSRTLHMLGAAKLTF